MSDPLRCYLRHAALGISTWESVSYVSNVSLNVTPPAALYKHSRKSNPSWIGKELRFAKQKCTFHAKCSSYGWEVRLTQGAKSQQYTGCQSLENRTIERPVVLIEMRKGSTYRAERSILRAQEELVWIWTFVMSWLLTVYMANIRVYWLCLNDSKG